MTGRGRRAIGQTLSEEKIGVSGTDRSKRLFFQGGWYEKIVQALRGWENLSAVSCIPEKDESVISKQQ